MVLFLSDCDLQGNLGDRDVGWDSDCGVSFSGLLGTRCSMGLGVRPLLPQRLTFEGCDSGWGRDGEGSHSLGTSFTWGGEPLLPQGGRGIGWVRVGEDSGLLGTSCSRGGDPLLPWEFVLASGNVWWERGGGDSVLGGGDVWWEGFGEDCEDSFLLGNSCSKGGEPLLPHEFVLGGGDVGREGVVGAFAGGEDVVGPISGDNDCGCVGDDRGFLS